MCRTRRRCARRERGRGWHAQKRKAVSKGENRGFSPLVALFCEVRLRTSPFISPWREKGNKRLCYVLFSSCNEKSTKRDAPKEETHGFFLWKLSSSQCAQFCLRQNCLRAVKWVVCQIAATAAERRARGQSPILVCRCYSAKCLATGGVAV